MTTTALTLAERARTAIGLPNEIEQQLHELAKRTTDIVVIVSPEDRAQVHGAMMTLKNQRIAIENAGKQARDDANKFAKAVIAEANRLCSIIEPEEGRLFDLRKKWDDDREAEKQAKIAAEQKRVADHQQRVADLRGNRSLTPMAGSARITEVIADLEGMTVDASFEEFEQQAHEAKADGLTWLRELHAAAVAHEAEQARIKAEREELARLRAEEEKRQAAERARIAEEERVAKAARDAEAAKQAEELRQMRVQQRQAAEAERKRIAEEEAAAKAIREAEAAKLAAERAEFEKQQAEARKVKEEQDRVDRERARLASIKKPADAELLGVLAQHYNVPVSKVVDWLLAIDFTKLEQAA